MRKTKVCSECGIEKSLTKFHKRSGKRKGQPRAACAKCANISRAMYSRQIREEALAHYGGACACCGEAHYEFLEFDHIYNDGAAHRRELFKNGGKRVLGRLFAEWLRANSYPSFIQILCRNCNGAKAFYGMCPHQVRREIDLIEAKYPQIPELTSIKETKQCLQLS